MLCALAFSAFAAQSAAAATKGTTAFTCKEVATGAQFSDAHCKTAKAGGSGFAHVAIAQGTTTKITGTNETTGGAKQTALLRSTQSGVEEELQAKVVEGSGSLINTIDESGEHHVHATGTITYKEVSVTKPAGKGCEVYEDTEKAEEGALGVVKTKEITGTSTGQGDRILIKPAVGEVFATFIITNCSLAALNGTYEVKGQLTATTEGATLVATEGDVTTQNTLKLRGQKAGLDGILTIKGKDETIPDTVYTPISVTTVETP